MKALKSFSFAVLFLSLITAFAFRPIDIKRFTPICYKLTVLGADNNPADYVPYTEQIPVRQTTCPPPRQKVSILCTNDVYLTGPFFGKPKVDLPQSGIAIRIAAVKNDTRKSGLKDTNGNTVWLESN